MSVKTFVKSPRPFAAFLLCTVTLSADDLTGVKGIFFITSIPPRSESVFTSI